MPNPNTIQIEIRKDELEYLLKQFELNFFKYLYNNHLITYNRIQTKKVLGFIPIKRYIPLSREESEKRYNEVGFKNTLKAEYFPSHYRDVYNTYSMLLSACCKPTVPIFAGNLALLLDVANVSANDIEKYTQKTNTQKEIEDE